MPKNHKKSKKKKRKNKKKKASKNKLERIKYNISINNADEYRIMIDHSISRKYRKKYDVLETKFIKKRKVWEIRKNRKAKCKTKYFFTKTKHRERICLIDDPEECVKNALGGSNFCKDHDPQSSFQYNDLKKIDVVGFIKYVNPKGILINSNGDYMCDVEYCSRRVDGNLLYIQSQRLALCYLHTKERNNETSEKNMIKLTVQKAIFDKYTELKQLDKTRIVQPIALQVKQKVCVGCYMPSSDKLCKPCEFIGKKYSKIQNNLLNCLNNPAACALGACKLCKLARIRINSNSNNDTVYDTKIACILCKEFESRIFKEKFFYF